MDWARISKSATSLMANQIGLKSEFTWNGKTYWGCRSIMRKEIVNTDAGLAGEYNFSLLCPFDEFCNARPQSREKVVVDGVVMRVLGVESDAVNATLKLHLGGELA